MDQGKEITSPIGGIIGAEVQLGLFETTDIRLECPYRLNQRNWKPTFIPFAKARKRVETLFSQLTDQLLVIRNYAKETCGLFARIIGKVSALPHYNTLTTLTTDL